MKIMDSTPIITSIKPLKGDPLRCVVRVGKEKVATLKIEHLGELGIRVGDVWDEATAARVGRVAMTDEARRKALSLINRRDYSSGELANKLRQKGYESAVIEPLVADLLAKRYLDDEAYGRSAIASIRARKPAGRRLIEQKLMLKRLPRKLIEKLVREAEGEHDAVGEARRLAEQRLKSAALRRCEPAKRRQRVWSLLARRGFDPGVIAQAMRGLSGLSDEDEPTY
ncbi:MAG: hypothetical protein GC162_12425 [Planctomycetes bacterium]|nr:hypothetical protein [Planctomycetota bacterium]